QTAFPRLSADGTRREPRIPKEENDENASRSTSADLPLGSGGLERASPGVCRRAAPAQVPAAPRPARVDALPQLVDCGPPPGDPGGRGAVVAHPPPARAPYGPGHTRSRLRNAALDDHGSRRAGSGP